MQARPYRNVPGNINVCARFIHDAFDPAIGHDAVVATECLGEGDVLIAGETNDVALEARSTNKCRCTEPRLGGCGTDHDLLHTKPIVIQKQIGDHVTGHEQREKNAALVLKRLKLSGLRLCSCVIVVETGKLAAMRHGVGKPPLGRFTGLHQHMARHGEEAVKPFADGNAFNMARYHLANTPHRDLAPGIFPSGIKLPVSEQIT